MGLSPDSLDYIYQCARQTIGDLRGKKMLELGCQDIVDGGTISEKIAKEYFENRGVSHTSVDLSGLHGSLKIDLSRPIENPGWRGYFDIVTNSGTSEHVEPFEAQYECFMNIHDCLKTGGIAVHVVPDIKELEDKGRWKNHCNNYYSQEFFKMLATNNSYKIISSKIKEGMIWICLQKNKEIPFMKDRGEFSKYITRKSGGFIYACNDRWWYKRFFQKIRKKF